MTKQFMCVWLVASMLAATGCHQSDATHVTAEKEIFRAQHANLIWEKSSPYTLFYENSDGSSTLYLFTSPIAYYDEYDQLTLIDNDLVRSKEPGMAFENRKSDCKMYFPETADRSLRIQSTDTTLLLFPAEASGNPQLTSYIDLCGVSRTAVSYPTTGKKDILYLPTEAGITVMVTWREPSPDSAFSVFVSPPAGAAFAVTSLQDILLYDPDSLTVLGVIHTAPLLDRNGKAYLNVTTDVTLQADGRLLVTFTPTGTVVSDASHYPLTFSPSFDLYRSTLIGPAIWSGDPGNNDNLSAFIPLGQDEFLGTAEQYLRLRLNYICKTYGANIQSASYQPVVLGNISEPCTLEVFRVTELWGRHTISWNNRPHTGNVESATTLSSSGRIALDLTSLVRDGFDDLDWDIEANGLLLAKAADEPGVCILSTPQHSLYSPYIRIDFYETPWFFERIDTINPDE